VDDKSDFNADPLFEDAMLLFMNGSFVGLKLSRASRSCVAGRSPLTERATPPAADILLLSFDMPDMMVSS